MKKTLFKPVLRLIGCLLMYTWLMPNVQAQLTYSWGAQLGASAGMEQVGGIATDANGNVYVVGSFNTAIDFDPNAATTTLTPNGTSYDIYVAKYNSSGALQWARQIGSTGSDQGTDIALDGAGNYYIVGGFSGTVNFNPLGTANNLTSFGAQDGFVAKYTESTGALVFVNIFGTAGNEIAKSCSVNATGVVLGGSSTLGTGGLMDMDPSAGTANVSTASGFNTSAVIAKYSTTGAYIWANGFVPNTTMTISDVEFDPSGDVYVGGQYNNFSSQSFDFSPGAVTVTFPASTSNGAAGYLMKYNGTNGNGIWGQSIVPAGPNATVNDIIFDTNGEVLFTGNAGSGGNVAGTNIPNTGNANTANRSFCYMARSTSAGVLSWVRGLYVQQTGDFLSAGALVRNGSNLMWLVSFKGTINQINPAVSTSALVSTGTNHNLLMARYTLNGTTAPTYLVNQTTPASSVNGVSPRASNNGNDVYIAQAFTGTADMNFGTATANFTQGGSFSDDDIILAKYAACSSVLSITTQPAANTTLCPGASGTLNVVANTTGSTALSYQWQVGLNLLPGNASSYTITNASAANTGTYYVGVSDGCYTVYSDAANVTLGTAATLTLNGGASTASIGCTTTSVNLFPSGGNCTSFLWSTGATTSQITVSTAGTYIVTGTNASGCTTTATITVTGNTNPPTVGISGGPLGCSTTTTLTATGNASTYNWTVPGSSTFTGTSFNASASNLGTYTITGTGSNGCTASATFTLTQNNTAPTVTITGGNTLNCTTPSLTLTATGANTYIWNGGVTTATRNVTTAGTYTVIGTASNGCTATASVVVTANTTAPSVAIATPNGTVISCTSPTLSLNASGANTYAWTGGSSNATLNATTAGTYTVTGTGTNGCTATTSVAITGNTIAPTVSISGGGGQLTCANPSITLTASGANTYTWTGGSTNATLSVSAAGTYTVTGTSSINGCTASATTTITASGAVPTISINAPNTVITCSTPSINLTTTANNVNTYAWTGGSTASSLTVNTAGTYTVTATNTSNGCTTTATVSITTNTTAPTVSISGSTVLTCTNPSLTLTASGANTYTWTGGVNTPTLTVNAINTYSVTGTASNGCTATASVNVSSIILNPLVFISNVSPAQITCASGATITADGANAYTWSNGGSGATLTVTTPGTYIVTGTNTTNGCTATATVSVSANTTAPTVSIATPNIITCTSPAVLNASGANTYVWSNNGNTPSISVTTPGVYTVTGTNTSNGCSATATVNVQAGNLTPPNLSISSSVDTINCIQTTALIAASGANTYAWYDNTNTFTGNGVDIIVSQQGTYSVVGTDASNGCTASASYSIVANNTPPVVVIDGAQNSNCNNTPVTLVASGADTYNWWMLGNILNDTLIATQTGYYEVIGFNNTNGCNTIVGVNVSIGQTTSSNINTSICAGDTYNFNGQVLNAAGTYMDTLVNTSGCDSMITLQLSVNPLPVITITQNGTNDLVATSGFSNYQWLLSGTAIAGATNATYTPTANGNYTVQATNTNLCTGTSNTLTVTNVGLATFESIEAFDIMPNPTDDILNIRIINSQASDLSLSLYNLNGQLLSQQQVSGQHINTDMQLGVLASGMYILRLSDATHTAERLVVKN